VKGYLCSMQLDEETAECLLCIFAVCSTNKYLKLNLHVHNSLFF